MKVHDITSERTWKGLLSELWEYKEVFFFLGWRDILVHYKQTVIGVAWVIIRPLLTVLIFTILFSKIAGIQSESAPYPLIVFSAMLVWQFFLDILTYASASFLSNQQLVSKVYFPRIIIPASRILCSLVDFSVAFMFYILLSLFYYKFIPPLQLLLLPFFLIWLVVLSFSISLLFASLIVRYRDFRHIIPFVGQLGLYGTSVGFTLSMVPKRMVVFLGVNPLIGVINGFRWTLVGEQLHLPVILVSMFMTICFFLAGCIYFKSVQDTFADIL